MNLCRVKVALILIVQILIALQYNDITQCYAACKPGWICDSANINGKYYWECCDCFPASAKVSLENGKSVTMSELQMGDAVKSGELIFVLE